MQSRSREFRFCPEGFQFKGPCQATLSNLLRVARLFAREACVGTTERACTRRSCSQETRIPPLLHPIYTPQIDKAPQNRRRELLQPDNAANQVPICVRRSETVVSHAQAKHTHARTDQTQTRYPDMECAADRSLSGTRKCLIGETTSATSKPNPTCTCAQRQPLCRVSPAIHREGQSGAERWTPALNE